MGKKSDLTGAVLADVGPMNASKVKDHIDARAMLEEEEGDKPYSAKTIPAALLFGSVNANSL